MKKTIKPLAAALSSAALLFSLLPNQAEAAGKLTVYCSTQNITCEKVMQAFGKKFDVNVQFIRNSTGATLSKIKAEANNPQADVWYGGTIEHHYQAGSLGLLEKYRPTKQADILPDFKAMLKNPKSNYTSIIYMLALGFGVNTERFTKLGIKEYPKCWKDLTSSTLKGEIQLADPQLSGTTYTAIATLIELWGEDKTFDYLKKLDVNVAQYVKSAQVTSNLARGESALSVGFIHNYATEKENGAPIETILPCEGVGYSLGGASILKGARNIDNAKLFMDWVVDAEAQEIPWREGGVYQLPTNINAVAAPQSVNPKSLNLIKIDFERFGDSAEGKRITEKWLKEVKIK